MSSNNCAKNSYFVTSRARLDAAFCSCVGFRNFVRLLAVALAGAALAACAQSSVVTNKSQFRAAARTAPLEKRVTFRPKKHSPVVAKNPAAGTKRAPYGLASFYTEGEQTASGEKFDSHELTAAHPTLPFGTRLRVTNVANGRSVTVRVNDRGPFVPGRVVDVSYSAAETLGIVGRGVAKVKLDVVQ